MISQAEHSTVGLLLSGGLDSSILLGRLIEQGQRVQPFYIRADFVWQQAELRAVHTYLAAMGPLRKAPDQLADLVLLAMPLADLYEGHWSMTGHAAPDNASPEQAAYLPGHNLLLLIKAALWCRMRGIDRLALGSLSTNPFADATPSFFDSFETTMRQATGAHVTILRPFQDSDKRHVMQIGRHYPLHLTFSCLAPVGGLHCGRCNKCGERRSAFQWLPAGDPTVYAWPAPATLAAR